MPAPVPVWWDVAQNQATLTWNCGTVDADSYSNEKEFYVFNNKGGASDVSDMTNVFITTKDTNGNDAGPVAGPTPVAAVEVSVFDGVSWGEWKEIRGSDPANQAVVVNASGDGQAVIKGTRNISDPTDTNYNNTETKKKYARLKLRLHVFASAPAGPMSWKTRISYQYT